MSADFVSAPRPHARRWVLSGTIAVLTLLAGCATTPKPEATEPKEDEAVAPAAPSDVAQTPAEQSPPEGSTAQAKTSQRKPTAAAGTPFSSRSKAEGEAGQPSARTTAPKAQQPAIASANRPRPTTGDQPAANVTQRIMAKAQPTKRVPAAGCGDTTTATRLEMNPPPKGQPQPKFTCKQQKVVLDPIWQGEAAVFAFDFSNTGQAPLKVHLKGG